MSDNLKVAKECGAFVKYQLTSALGKVPAEVIFNVSELEAYTSRILASQQAAHEAEIAKLKDDEFSESKDWKESDISGRIDWLMSRVKSCREDIALLTEQQAECEQRGAVKALEELYDFHGETDWYGKIREVIESVSATSKKAG